MSFRPFENMKGFLSSRPPLIVFMVCLTAFAVTTISLAYFVRAADLKDPDVAEEWNVFFKNFAELDFCVLTNRSSLSSRGDLLFRQSHGATALSVHSSIQAESSTESSIESDLNKNFSISVRLNLSPEFLLLTTNISHFSGTLKGEMLGLSGFAASEELNVTFDLPNDRNATTCLSHEQCNKVQACVTFNGSPSVFPLTRKSTSCSITNSSHSEHTVVANSHESSAAYSSGWCNQGVQVHVSYVYDPNLTVMLSLHERSIINLHLMHTSYFLFVMVLTLVCYAVLRGRPKNKNYNLLEKNFQEA